MEGLGPKEEKAEQCLMSRCHRRWIPPPIADKKVRVPIAPGCVYFGWVPLNRVLTRSTSASEMQWASMAMHYTASMPVIQDESHGVEKYDNKKKEYKCP